MSVCSSALLLARPPSLITVIDDQSLISSVCRHTAPRQNPHIHPILANIHTSVRPHFVLLSKPKHPSAPPSRHVRQLVPSRIHTIRMARFICYVSDKLITLVEWLSGELSEHNFDKITALHESFLEYIDGYCDPSHLYHARPLLTNNRTITLALAFFTQHTP